MDLIYASRDGDIGRVRRLLDGGVDINAVARDGWKVSLLTALSDGWTALRDGWTALHYAAFKEHYEIVRLLLDRGADINVVASNGRTALHYAALRDNCDIPRLLLDRGADINAVTSKGRTALHEAVSAFLGHLGMVRLLLDRGADINVVASNGRTALTEAAWGGHLEMVRLFVDRGADINVADSNGMTALHYAAGAGRIEVVRLLLDRGADINAVASDGRTALMKAALRGDLEMVRLLLDRGADINVADSEGMTALHYAADGHLEIVRLLIERGADTEAINVDGETALALALAEDSDWEDNSDIEEDERYERRDERDYVDRRDRREIIALLKKAGRKKKPRITCDWMEICDSLGTAKLAELRAIVDQHVVRSNFDRVKTFFEFTGTFSGFKAYVATLSKRQICAYLARYYDAVKPKYQHGCSVNESNFAGDDFSDLPPERVIKLTQDGFTYCFDVLEVASFDRKNPYTNAELPESFLRQAARKARSIPKDIHELKQRGRTGAPSLKDEVVALQDRADTAVPYFPRRKFGLLTTKRLQNLANRLAEYDPSFGLVAVKREVAAAELKNKPLVWKRAILKRLITHPETLGNVLNEWISTSNE